MGKARNLQVVNFNQPREVPFENLSKEARADLVKKLKDHLFEHSRLDVDTGCWEPSKSGNGTNLCINNKDNGRVILNFSGFLKNHNIKHEKNSTAVAQAFFKLLGVEKEKYNASHLCHNPKCMNPQHLVFEDAEYNRSRNYCCGGEGCLHEPKCLSQGVRFFIIKNAKEHFTVP